MARKKRGRIVNGLLLYNKPLGISSNQALQRVKHLFKAQKAGHTGTLDPAATGLLPLCFGEATKFSQYLLDADKTYETSVCFGVTTNTGDADGEPRLIRDASALTASDITQALPILTGTIEQTPPMYSALKHHGTPLYQLARQGKSIERKPRCVTIHQFELRQFTPGKKAFATFHVHCSKGTYIRSLAMDLGDHLCVGGHVTALHRSQIGPLTLDPLMNWHALSQQAAQNPSSTLDALLLPTDTLVKYMPSVALTATASYDMRLGKTAVVQNTYPEQLVRLYDACGQFIGIGECISKERIQPKRLITQHE